MYLIIIFIGGIIAIFTYLIFLGANKCKTEEEKILEDEEQMKFLKEYKNGGNKIER